MGSRDNDDVGRTDDRESGTHQNIGRATLVLAALAEAGARGLRLADVTRLTQLSRTAAHRCLAGLTRYGLAVVEDERGRFYLGDQIFAWSTMATDRFALVERAAPYVCRLAEETEDTAYFMLRRGDYAVCLGRAEGHFPIKTLTMAVGDRRRLGTNTGSLAILSFLPKLEVERLLDALAADESGIARHLVQDLVKATQALGYSYVEGQVMTGMSGLGVPVRGATGLPVAALSVAAISPRLNGPRQERALSQLRLEASRMEEELLTLLPG